MRLLVQYSGFIDQKYKYNLNGKAGLEQHKLICETNYSTTDVCGLPQTPKSAHQILYTSDRDYQFGGRDNGCVLRKTVVSLQCPINTSKTYTSCCIGFRAKLSDISAVGDRRRSAHTSAPTNTRVSVLS